MLMSLTPTQIRVLYWLAKGRTVKEITMLLCVSRRTITSHISSAKWRLGAHSRDETVALAVKGGLLEINIETLA